MIYIGQEADEGVLVFVSSVLDFDAFTSAIRTHVESEPNWDDDDPFELVDVRLSLEEPPPHDTLYDSAEFVAQFKVIVRDYEGLHDTWNTIYVFAAHDISETVHHAV